MGPGETVEPALIFPKRFIVPLAVVAMWFILAGILDLYMYFWSIVLPVAVVMSIVLPVFIAKDKAR